MENKNENKKELNISVRNLVEFTLRTGDIDDSKASGDSSSSMKAGQLLHKKLQKKAGSAYHAEVPLRHVISFEDYDFVIDGRADGIVFDDEENPILIDEIKGVHRDVLQIEEVDLVHKAQAMFYGYFVCLKYDLDGIDIQVTYGNLDDKSYSVKEELLRRFKEFIAVEELEEFVYQVVEKYKPFLDFEYNWSIVRRESISSITFPFEYREGQKPLMGNVYNAINSKELLFIQAPTGVGKTIGTIYPSLKAMNDNGLGKIIYLTAKTITKTVAINTFSMLIDRGCQIKTLEITAKDKVCFQEVRKCDPIHCEYAKGFYDRINDALYDFITSENMFTRDNIIQYSNKHKVCPYELALEISRWADAVICDYNYAFDPSACIINSMCGNSRNIFLVDEAHNLVDRAREMYSSEIIKEEVLAMKKIYGAYDSKLIKYFDKVNKQLLALKKQCEENLILHEIDQLMYAIDSLYGRLQAFWEKRIKMKNKEEALEFYFKIMNFVETGDFLDSSYSIYCDYKAGDFRVRLFNMDPSLRLQSYLDNAVSTIFFSATLLPINYYKELLCTKENVKAIYAKTIFESRQRALLIANDVTSKYSRRSSEEYGKIALYLEKLVAAKKGNYIAFFPSYAFMENVYNIFLDKNNNCEIIVQGKNMTETEREAFLGEFENDRDNSLLAFCVLGGIFAEGIDLDNDKLIGTAIVGTGLPQTNFELDLLCEHFDNSGKNGFDYAYRFPGMNKVCQAAGRVIRTVDDRGIILLLDERFLQYKYKQIFPREWKDYKSTSITTVESEINQFWDACD